MQHRWRRHVQVTVLAVMLMLVTVACGSSGSDGVDREQIAESFAREVRSDKISAPAVASRTDLEVLDLAEQLCGQMAQRPVDHALFTGDTDEETVALINVATYATWRVCDHDGVPPAEVILGEDPDTATGQARTACRLWRHGTRNPYESADALYAALDDRARQLAADAADEDVRYRNLSDALDAMEITGIESPSFEQFEQGFDRAKRICGQLLDTS